ncbi:MAG: HAD hydrolase family protein [Thomasclavelia ramosa]
MKTYAFGDGINDVEMLQLVKHGIAMGMLFLN